MPSHADAWGWQPQALVKFSFCADDSTYRGYYALRENSHMTRWLFRWVLLVAGIGAVVGCQGPGMTYVPWYRGIPANFLAKNSLEAEVWRQQRTGIVEGWPVPPNPVVPDPIPLAGSPRELAPDDELDDESSGAAETPSSRRSNE